MQVGDSALTNVLTLQLDVRSQAFFERLRRAHFPPERNLIPAHLTLFHTLPDTPEISHLLYRTAAAHPAFSMQVTGLRSLGRGVAYTLASPPLQALHAELREHLQDHLTPQDRQKFQPHIVVQNKSTPEHARALLATLQQDFTPFQVHAEGLILWHYLGGPWALAETIPLRTP
jgi:2'-5' RNA ligase